MGIFEYKGCGNGTYDLAMNALLMAKKIEYSRLEASATYTKVHENYGYSRGDITDFFEKLEVKATVSKVLTMNDELKCDMNIPKQHMREDIKDSIKAILLNKNTKHLNMHLYNVLLSLIFKAKTYEYCDDFCVVVKCRKLLLQGDYIKILCVL